MKIRLLIAAVLSGVMLSLPWLNFTGALLLVAFMPLLYIEDQILNRQYQDKPIVFWLYSLPVFLVWNGLTTWWIAHASLIGAMFAILLNSLLMSAVWWLAHMVKRSKGMAYGNFFLLFAWISFEYLHYQWDMSWPWLTLGNGFANDIALVQWYELTGVLGGTAWALSINLLAWALVRKFIFKQEARGLRQLIIPLVVLVFPVMASFIRYSTYQEKTDPVEVVISQPNIDPYFDKFSGMGYNDQFDRLIAGFDSLGTPDTRFFIGPETALHEVWENNPDRNWYVWSLKRYLNLTYPKAAAIVGASSYRKFEPGDSLPESVRYRNDSALIYSPYNSAFFIRPNKKVAIYHKSVLVSGVEKMPFQKFFRFLEPLILDLGGMTGTLGTQPEPSVFSHEETVAGVPICYESGYGEYLSGFVNKGANLFIVITNDGWWNNTPGYRQHLSFSRLRAIEFRRSVARCANTGISCFINQRGEIMQKTNWWEQTAIRANLNRNNSVTLYARTGDAIGQISAFMFFLMGLGFVVEWFRGIKKKKNRINPD